jgi:hypothetical protein
MEAGKSVKLENALEKTLERLFLPSLSSKGREILAGEWGEWEAIKYVPQNGGLRGELRLVLPGRKELSLPLAHPVSAPRFGLLRVEGGVWISNGHLFVTPKVVFFQGKVGEDLEETLRLVRDLRPLFHALRLPDLEGALEVLAGFKGEEARFHGPYVLAWSGKPEEPAFLRKGSLFGDPLLDGSFLTGRGVVLRYPRVKVTLEGKVNEKSPKTSFRMTGLTFEWEGMEASFVGGLLEGYLSCDLVLEERPGACLVRKGAEEILAKDLSRERDPLFRKLHGHLLLAPRMKALLEALVETQDPLKALGDEDFFRQVALRLLSFF